GNLTLMRIPGLGGTGAAGSLVRADMAALFSAVYILRGYIGVRADIKRCILSPAFAAILCAAVARLCYDRLFRAFSGGGARIILLISVITGGIIYIFSLYLLNIMPKRGKFQKKFKKIGKRG
ncbi:MAG: polysaccharide biosynthesis C-terminal domain-containing protein, partial [Ruminococcus sp.]|nr:polysaccharide biosynthesis C-terminal domain-containing protein [Ruminococcus sp.]